MIDVIASIRVKDGHRDEFIEKFKANLPAVLAEDGCMHYYPAVDAESGLAAQRTDPDTVTIVERWESIEALQAHSQAPHMASFRETVKDIVDGMRLTVVTAA